jgi:hypothetical protein
MLGAEAKFGEKLSDQKPVVCFSAVGAERTLGLLGQQPEHVYCRDGHVQVEVEFLLAACLAVGEAGVLFGVSDHRLNLGAQSVSRRPSGLFGMLAPIG